MSQLRSYLTLEESKSLEDAEERSGDLLVQRLVSIIDRLRLDVEHRSNLRPQRSDHNPNVFLLTSRSVYLPQEDAETGDEIVTFDRPDGSVNHPLLGSRNLFQVEIYVEEGGDEIASVVLTPKVQDLPNEQDSCPEKEYDDARQTVVIRSCVEDGVPVVRASMSVGPYLKKRTAGFTAELHATCIKIHLNGRTEAIEATPIGSSSV